MFGSIILNLFIRKYKIITITTNMFDKMLRKYKIGETLENPLQTVIKEKRGVDSFLFFLKT